MMSIFTRGFLLAFSLAGVGLVLYLVTGWFMLGISPILGSLIAILLSDILH